MLLLLVLLMVYINFVLIYIQMQIFLYTVPMQLPTKDEAKTLLESYVSDNYQRYHALMVATAVAGYARNRKEDEVYRIGVHLENGEVRQFDHRDLSALRVGDRVKLEGGQLSRL
jgi:hypothetical protein